MKRATNALIATTGQEAVTVPRDATVRALGALLAKGYRRYVIARQKALAGSREVEALCGQRPAISRPAETPIHGERHEDAA